MSEDELDLARLVTALRKGFIKGADAAAALPLVSPEHSLMDVLIESNALDPQKVELLLGSTVLGGSKDQLEELLRQEITQDTEPALYHVGERIGGVYEVLGSARGAFGQVYFCHAHGVSQLRRGNTRVALKTPLRTHLIDGEVMDLFRREAAHWISLPPHPNVVLAYGVEEHGRLPYIIIEFVEGAATLGDRIRTGTDWRDALEFGLGIARGLAHAQHIAKLTHSDLKPANILISPEGVVKVTDFALGVQGGEAKAGRFVMGTPGYIPPEMLRGESGRTQAGDIYAFGFTLFEIVSGQRPYPPIWPLRDDRDPGVDVREVQPSVPGEIATLIAQCLDGEPSRRPPSFAGIVSRLIELHPVLLGREAARDPMPDAPAESDALVNAYQTWRQVGEVAQAIAAARRAVAVDPRNWKAHCAVASYHADRKEFPQAAENYLKAHRLAPEEIVPISNLAQAYGEMGQAAEARRYVQLSIRLCHVREDYGPLHALSLQIAESFAPEEALGILNRIVADRPDAAIAWNNRAILLRRMGRVEEALESAERAIALNPVYGRAYVNRGNALLQLGRLEDALASAERALVLDEMLAGGYAVKAMALHSLGRAREARATVAEGLRVLPGDPRLRKLSSAF